MTESFKTFDQPWPLGRKINGIHQITDEEADRMGWIEDFGSGTEMTIVLVLEDGSWLVPSCDPEGNRGGCLFGVTTEDKDVIVWTDEGEKDGSDSK
mgnify:CR=1 FL=1